MASTDNVSLLMRIVSASVCAANQAGKIVRDVMKTGQLGIVDKGVNDLQTEADRSAQRCIVGSLSRMFPNVTIIGEENLDPCEKLPDGHLVTECDESVLSVKCPEEFAAAKPEDIVVWVDPLDGTNEYTQGFLDHVTVLIGIAVNGRAVAGVCHQPFYDYKNQKDIDQQGRTIWGVVGVGAFGVNRVEPPENQLVLTTTRSHGNAIINKTLEALQPNEIVRVGGAGHKVLIVIEGRAHAYAFPSPGCKKWDTCAPEAILTALGGRLTDIFGNDIKYHKDVQHLNAQGVFASCSTAVHDRCLAKIPEDVKAALLPTSSQM